jgi:hypothetical protein
MDFEAAEAAVRAFFNTHWNSATPIAWPDLSFTPPNGSWVRFNMKNTAAPQASIGAPGSNLFRRYGIVTIQVFQKEGQGSKDARAKSDKAADIFLTQTLSGFIFRNVNAREIGTDGAGWYQWNVTVEYQYDRIT